MPIRIKPTQLALAATAAASAGALLITHGFGSTAGRPVIAAAPERNVRPVHVPVAPRVAAQRPPAPQQPTAAEASPIPSQPQQPGEEAAPAPVAAAPLASEAPAPDAPAPTDRSGDQPAPAPVPAPAPAAVAPAQPDPTSPALPAASPGPAAAPPEAPAPVAAPAPPPPANPLPAGCETYTGSFTPDRFQVPAHGVDVPVLALGRDPTSPDRPAAPPFSARWTVGWFNESPKPGTGAGKINLTVHSYEDGNGLGNRLAAVLAEGNVIVLRGAGKMACYRYTGRTKLWLNNYDRNSTAYYDSAGEPTVAIMTCSDYEASSGVWRSRTVLYAARRAS